MVRVTFDSLFKKDANGQFQPTQKIRINGVTIGPGVSFSVGTIFGGIDLTKYEGHDFEINTDDGVVVLRGIYAK